MMRELKRVEEGGDGSVRIDAWTGVDGVTRRVVYIPGTEDWGAWSGNPADAEANLALMAGRLPGAARTVVDALAASGATERDPVLLVGHSQGGMVAAALAASPAIAARFHIDGIVTAGSPVGRIALPRTVSALHLEGTRDLVPGLDGRAQSRHARTHHRPSRCASLGVVRSRWRRGERGVGARARDLCGDGDARRRGPHAVDRRVAGAGARLSRAGPMRRHGLRAASVGRLALARPGTIADRIPTVIAMTRAAHRVFQKPPIVSVTHEMWSVIQAVSHRMNQPTTRENSPRVRIRIGRVSTFDDGLDERVQRRHQRADQQEHERALPPRTRPALDGDVERKNRGEPHGHRGDDACHEKAHGIGFFHATAMLGG